MSNTATPAATGQTTAVATKQASITDTVLARVSAMQTNKELQLPPDYSAANALKSAHLILLETVDKNGKSVLETCSKESIANSLLSMVLQGLNPDKKQAYFIAYNGKLQMQRSYAGTIALAKRVADVSEVHAQVVYEGDDFGFHIDVTTGKTVIAKHVPDFTKHEGGKIIGAYAIVTLNDQTRKAEYMTYGQIQRSWQQNRANNGASPAHTKFPEEMCKKTVINRALKVLVNSSTDGNLFDGEDMDEPVKVVDTGYTEVKQEIAEKASTGKVVDFEATQPAQVHPAITQKQPEPEPVMADEEQPDF